MREHRPPIRRLVERRVEDVGLRDDVEQEVWLRVHRLLPSFRGDSAVGTWLYGVASNVIRELLRGECRRLDRERAGRVPEQHGPWPDEVADNARTLRRLRAALRALPPKRRAAVILHAVDGVAMTAVSAMTGQPVGTVMSGSHYGLRLLKKCLT